MPTDELEKSVQLLDRKLTAVAALLARLVAVIDDDLPAPRHPSMEALLSSAGLTQTEIGSLLGKSRQAVQQALAKADGK